MDGHKKDNVQHTCENDNYTVLVYFKPSHEFCKIILSALVPQYTMYYRTLTN